MRKDTAADFDTMIVLNDSDGNEVYAMASITTEGTVIEIKRDDYAQADAHSVSLLMIAMHLCTGSGLKAVINDALGTITSMTRQQLNAKMREKSNGSFAGDDELPF